jgi:hypothetical protein
MSLVEMISKTHKSKGWLIWDKWATNLMMILRKPVEAMRGSSLTCMSIKQEDDGLCGKVDRFLE